MPGSRVLDSAMRLACKDLIVAANLDPTLYTPPIYSSAGPGAFLAMRSLALAQELGRWSSSERDSVEVRRRGIVGRRSELSWFKKFMNKSRKKYTQATKFPPKSTPSKVGSLKSAEFDWSQGGSKTNRQFSKIIFFLLMFVLSTLTAFTSLMFGCCCCNRFRQVSVCLSVNLSVVYTQKGYVITSISFQE
jgi:hypothetical protein